MDNDITATVCCITYNSAPYIRQCIDAILSQNTNFRFEILIHDDASTDGTEDIIREYELKYPDLIRPIYQSKNIYSQGISPLVQILFPLVSGRYIAICEGDDYWIDPLKLQKQIDFLEGHIEYGLVHTKAKCFFQKDNIFGKATIGYKGKSIEDFLLYNRIATLTTCFRKDLMLKYIADIKPETRKWKMGDYPEWLYFAKNSNIFFMDEVTAVYRVLNNSASHFSSIQGYEKFEQSVLDIKLYFKEKYDISVSKQTIYDIHYRVLVNLGIKFNERKYCVENFRKIRKKGVKDFGKYILCSFAAGFSFLHRRLQNV